LITGITRVRNESLIIEDTLTHWLNLLDRVVLYDDASTDDTADIAESFDRVQVIRGKEWLPDRPAEETRHRALLLDAAQADWVLCFDADERFCGDLPPLTGNGWRFRLFDGYMTPECDTPYTGGSLQDLPRMWGPEYRDILMMFRADAACYAGLDRREPVMRGAQRAPDAYVMHYGKCLSVEHWEETCDYYAEHWPEPYRSKWAARRGNAVHTRSDFGSVLYEWPIVTEFGRRLRA
jgi:hypothetical protein